MISFHRLVQACCAAIALASAGCAGMGEAADEAAWLDASLEEGRRIAPPATVPRYQLDPEDRIEVAATTRRLLVLAAQVRARAEAIADEPVDTGAYVRQARERNAPPPAPGS
ncbi:hypothetical protein [Marinicauda pacifica]|uniref:hypothetical protein n=1 Tax=Marinicauda pacifica TaxID=1133559 RepID=UPI0035C83C50